MYELSKIIGKKIVAIKALQSDRRVKTGLTPRYILFNDKSIVVELAEQDYYSYHDFAYSARHITVHKDKRLRKIISDNEDGIYPDANYDL